MLETQKATPNFSPVYSRKWRTLKEIMVKDSRGFISTFGYFGTVNNLEKCCVILPETYYSTDYAFTSGNTVIVVGTNPDTVYHLGMVYAINQYFTKELKNNARNCDNE